MLYPLTRLRDIQKDLRRVSCRSQCLDSENLIAWQWPHDPSPNETSGCRVGPKWRRKPCIKSRLACFLWRRVFKLGSRRDGFLMLFCGRLSRSFFFVIGPVSVFT
ncbi:hypothetical protein CDAR_289141 [Caerostris darwini]|uniref:Uncharacterized protein n=1 Tax=Caerostris darwini TaxID=1538125 RepID=A0AAV4PEH6_9ARAC|nr:hypothetical protein CDAR_289141 [Caerostris darwini]